MNKLRHQSLVALSMSFLLAAQAASAEKLRLTWSDAGRAISGKKVSIVLLDGAEVGGQGLEVQPDALRLDVKKTSNRTAPPKGSGLLPRQEISAVRLSRHGFVWQLAGTGAGFFGGAFLGAEMALHSYGDDSGLPGLILGLAVWAAVGV